MELPTNTKNTQEEWIHPLFTALIWIKRSVAGHCKSLIDVCQRAVWDRHWTVNFWCKTLAGMCVTKPYGWAVFHWIWWLKSTQFAGDKPSCVSQGGGGGGGERTVIFIQGPVLHNLTYPGVNWCAMYLCQVPPSYAHHWLLNPLYIIHLYFTCPDTVLTCTARCCFNYVLPGTRGSHQAQVSWHI